MIKEKLYSYHFDCGNSTDGPIGFCARVRAKTKKEALEVLKKVLPTELKVPLSGQTTRDDAAAIEYIEIYISPDNIKIDDIDEYQKEEDR